MLTRKVIAMAILVCFTPQIALADRIVLRNGEEMRGTVANRDEVETVPSLYETIGILVEYADGTSELLRFPKSEIEYIVIEQSDGDRVIDLVTLTDTPESSPASPHDVSLEARRNKSYGVLSIVAGGAIVTVGIAHKFGGPELKITESGTDYKSETYDLTNYFLIGAGSLFVIGGLLLLARNDSYSRTTLSLRNGQHGGYLAVSYRF